MILIINWWGRLSVLITLKFNTVFIICLNLILMRYFLCIFKKLKPTGIAIAYRQVQRKDSKYNRLFIFSGDYYPPCSRHSADHLYHCCVYLYKVSLWLSSFILQHLGDFIYLYFFNLFTYLFIYVSHDIVSFYLFICSITTIYG